MNYFISDLHVGHINCLAFDNRPFINIDEHDAYLIKNWNETVGIDDDVYILGDISWYNSTKTIEIFKIYGKMRKKRDGRLVKVAFFFMHENMHNSLQKNEFSGIIRT